jgi:transglutaminase-like putative cysteine protease
LAFALILNVNATSAATTNETSSVNTDLNTGLSSNMTSSTNTISATASKASTSTNTQVSTTAKTVVTYDKTIPKVVRTDPSYNEKVSTSKTIKITFSEKIKMGTGFIELRNNKGKVAIKTAIYGNALYINPVKNLIAGNYVLYLHTGSVKDLAGNNVRLFGTRFNAVPTVKPVSSSIFAKYLVATSHCQSNSPTIKALAKRITGSSTSNYTKAVKIFNWVRDHISYSFYYNTKYGALGTLNKRSANCADTAHLMVALTRAAGIPARYNHGSCRFSSGHVYGHVWAQVFVNGKWYYADGTSSRNSFGVVKNWNTSSFTLKGIYASLPF